MNIKWIRTAILLALLLAILVSLAPRSVRAQTAVAMGDYKPLAAEGYNGPPLIWPLATGYNWRVTAGYNTTHHGGDSQGSLGNKGDKFTFDLVRADGTYSAGQNVYAAQDGKIGPLDWMFQVYDANGNPTNYYVYHGHFILKPELKLRFDRRDEVKVEQGDLIGTIDNLAHLHFGVARWNGPGAASANFPDDPGWVPVYFQKMCETDPVSGKCECNKAYPFHGGENEYAGTVIEPCRDDQPTPPTANAGGPYTANEGETVILDASGSSDPDGMIVSYEWDLDGDGEYDDATGQTPSWTWGDDYAGNISLKVTDDGGATGTDTTTVTISNVVPTVDAGPDQTVFRNDVIALSGAWTDPAGRLDELYSWAWDVTGDGITDSSGSASYGSVVPASTSFATEGIYTLTFAVTDKDGGTSSDSMVVKVLNRPPDCSAAAPSIKTIWPPNHKFLPVNILRVTDPEGDPVSITINSIRQDEPVDTVGNGRFSPDGKGIGTDTAHVRAERVGTKKAPGNGRVYHIGFTADDGHGGSCSRKVLVGVPHDRKDISPVNDGALYNSTALAP